jgi:N-acetylmuramoyl-L-alanine amidase
MRGSGSAPPARGSLAILARPFLAPALGLLAAAAAGGTARPALALTEVLNRRTVTVQEIGNVKYIALETFQDALGVEGDQTLTGSYRLFGAPGVTEDVVVEFSADSLQVLVNDKESRLRGAPVLSGGRMLLPYEDFVALFLPGHASGKPDEPRAAGPSTLLDVSYTRAGSLTTITFHFTSQPDYRFRFDGDTSTLQVVFRRTDKRFTGEEIDVDSEEVSRVTLEPITHQGLLVASIHLLSDVTYDSSYDEAGHQVVLRLKGPGSGDASAARPRAGAGRDMPSFLANGAVVLDPGHGGDDRGVAPQGGKTEARLTLDLALRIKPLLEKGGFKVVLTRNSEGGLTVPDRLAAINSRAAGLVVSLHMNASADPNAGGTQIYVPKPPTGRDPGDPFAARRGIRGPSPEEVQSARLAARKMMTALSKALKRRVELIEDSQVMPAARVFAPAVTIEVAYLTSARERAQLDRKSFLDKLTYAFYSGIYEHYLERWKASGGSGAPVPKLQDMPSLLPPPEKAAPAPVKAAVKKDVPPVAAPESANALDGEDEEPMDGPDGPDGPAPDASRPRDVLPRAAAVPPRAPPPAAPRQPGRGDPADEDEEDEVDRVIRSARPPDPAASAAAPGAREATGARGEGAAAGPGPGPDEEQEE